MAFFTTTTIRSTEGSIDRLKRESKSREDYIAQIKRHVAQDEDNIKHPVPLFTQLTRNS